MGAFDYLPALTDRAGQPVPKPEPLKKTKDRKDREDEKRLKAFRDVVWAREHKKLADWTAGAYARCQHCSAWVWRESSAGVLCGEVHHRIGRRVKATRYDPDNGVLLCQNCHRAVQEHRITV